MAGTSTQTALRSTPTVAARKSDADIPGPRNPEREMQNPNMLHPPSTDKGTLPNLRWTFADSHSRVENGGWARETTVRELPVSTAMAGVNMRLKAGSVREMHWHKEAEWALMLVGRARVTAVDVEGRTFQDDVNPGDIWYFPAGIPHSIQALESTDLPGAPDGCEFLLVFDDGNFSENSTFLITDWLAHTPRDVLAKNFGWPESAFDQSPKEELYIFPAPLPAQLASERITGEGPVPQRFTHRFLAQSPSRTAGGTVRIADTSNFPAAATLAASLVELEPGGLRELHWHPSGDEWQYWISGEGRMTVFASGAKARTFDYRAGDVGYVPFAMGHYIENTGSTTLRYLEMFRNSRYADVSLAQWMALTQPALVQAHLGLAPELLASLRTKKMPVVPP